MPYIRTKARKRLEARNNPISGSELNYTFTKCIADYLSVHGVDYDIIEEVVSALENCKLEFYRRIAAPYEDKKILENGDVYSQRVLQEAGAS